MPRYKATCTFSLASGFRDLQIEKDEYFEWENDTVHLLRVQSHPAPTMDLAVKVGWAVEVPAAAESSTASQESNSSLWDFLTEGVDFL